MSTALPPVPPALLDPAAPWVFSWVIPIVGGGIVVLAMADSIRRRRLTWGFLFLVNSMLVFWMETLGDWGQHLVYSPHFAHHHLLDWMPVKTPYDPVFMPFAYAVYWTVHALVVLHAARWLVRRFGWSLLTAIVVLGLPVNYAWDFFVEASAAALGWWTYDPGFGPVLEFANGGKLTLVWTIGVMSFWPNLMAFWANKPPVHSLNHFERFFLLDRWTRPHAPSVPSPGADAAAAFDAGLDYEVTVPRWKFEFWRFVAWFVVFQVTFALLAVGPIVLMRVVTGHGSPYAP